MRKSVSVGTTSHFRRQGDLEESFRWRIKGFEKHVAEGDSPRQRCNNTWICAWKGPEIGVAVQELVKYIPNGWF